MRKAHWPVMLAVAAVYVGGAIYRLEKTLPRRIIDHDEGHALLNANTWHHIAWWVLQGGPAGGGDGLAAVRDELHREGGTLYTAGKFGYSLLVALAALPAQVTVDGALTLAWLAGIMLPLVAGGIAWQYGRSYGAAAIAVAGCFTSPLLQGLSAEVSGTIWALLFVLSGYLMLQRGVLAGRPWRWGLPGGVALAAGFTCHFNVAPLVAAALVGAVLFARARRGAGTVGWRVAVAPLVGFAVVMGLLEAGTQVADWRLRDVFPDYRSMLGDLWHILTRDQAGMARGIAHGSDMAMGWGGEAWRFWGNIALTREPGFALLAVVLLPVLMWVNRGQWRGFLPAAVMFLLPLAFYAAHPAKVERVLGMVVACGWVWLAVLAAPWLTDWNRTNLNLALRARGLALVLVAGITLPWFAGDRAAKAEESPMSAIVGDTLRYMQREGGSITRASFDAGFEPLWKWTLVEALRRDEFMDVRGDVDFSSMEEPGIVFEAHLRDGGVGRAEDTGGAGRGEGRTSGTVIARVKTVLPPWSLRVVRVR